MAERAGRTGWMLVVGTVLLIGLLGAAVALWIGSGQRHADNVAGLARAPVGCDTTLDFDATGTFVLYTESSGEFDALAGDCDVERRYDRDPDDVPELSLTLVDPRGEDVAIELDDVDDISYDVDGFVGSAVGTVQIETSGDHVLTVDPTGGAPFAVAVGRSVDDGVALLRVGAVAAAIGGLVLGGLFLVLGSRRPAAPSAPLPAWTPDGAGWPASPPGFPAPPPTTGATGPGGPPPTTGAPGSVGSPVPTPPASPWAPPSPPSPASPPTSPPG